MPLTDLWLHSRDQLEDKHVQQIIAFAGTGQLRDGNAGSAEFRDFLSHVPSNLLRWYADQCLQEGFSGSGFALQDIINEVGGRLGFQVSHGRYRGSPGQIGHDGLWLSRKPPHPLLPGSASSNAHSWGVRMRSSELIPV